MGERHHLGGLGNRELLSGLTALVQRGNRLTAELLAYLAEVDARRLHLELGFPSLFAYCVEQLGMSESAAGRRIASARLCREFPRALSAVASGELHLSALCALRPHLTPDNAPDLFAACSRKSRRQVDELLARRFPMSDVRARIRRLPRPANAVFEPLSVDRFAVHFTASATLKTKIETAQALAAHRLPSGGLAALVELAFDALIDRLHKQRFALDAPTRKECSRPALRKMSRPTEPRQARAPTESAPRSRHIPATVRREVFARDGAQCTFIAADGRRCSARALLELDHAEPWALGGPSTPANLRLRCRAHNQLAARQRFGPRCIAAHSAARAAR